MCLFAHCSWGVSNIGDHGDQNMDVRERELRKHIATMFDHYREVELDFLEYVDEVLKSFEIVRALNAFRMLTDQIYKPTERACNVVGQYSQIIPPKTAKKHSTR